MDITSANSTFTLNVPDVFPTPQTIQGYATDDAFAIEEVDVAEIFMGVDGLMSGGFTPFVTPLRIALQADSPSIDTFQEWLAAMKSQRAILVATATIDIPSISKSYDFNIGMLNKVKQVPDAKKVLQPMLFTISWQDVNAVPLST
jgi:hypothetical protein